MDVDGVLFMFNKTVTLSSPLIFLFTSLRNQLCNFHCPKVAVALIYFGCKTNKPSIINLQIIC